jgi:putative hydrolase of HD superfamily
MTHDYPSIERIAELQQLIADFSRVQRVPQLADTGRAENDVEHSFGLALTCWFLAPKIAPKLNLQKILCYALAHDTVEIHAGDTFVFGPQEHIDSKSAREDAAIKQLRADWPDFPEMVDAAKGYKDKVDEEAKFVKAVDKLLPILMVNLGEKADFWNRHKVTLQMEIENKKSLKVSDHFAPYYDQLVKWMQENDYFYDGPAE